MKDVDNRDLWSVDIAASPRLAARPGSLRSRSDASLRETRPFNGSRVTFHVRHHKFGLGFTALPTRAVIKSLWQLRIFLEMRCVAHTFACFVGAGARPMFCPPISKRLTYQGAKMIMATALNWPARPKSRSSLCHRRWPVACPPDRNERTLSLPYVHLPSPPSVLRPRRNRPPNHGEARAARTLDVSHAIVLALRGSRKRGRPGRRRAVLWTAECIGVSAFICGDLGDRFAISQDGPSIESARIGNDIAGGQSGRRTWLGKHLGWELHKSWEGQRDELRTAPRGLYRDGLVVRLSLADAISARAS